MSAMFIIQFAIVLLCILVGARVGGIGLGVFSGLGLAILSFGFGLKPAGLPIDVMFMIMAVVSAAAAMQAAGGLDYMIKIATRILRKPEIHYLYRTACNLDIHRACRYRSRCLFCITCNCRGKPPQRYPP